MDIQISFCSINLDFQAPRHGDRQPPAVAVDGVREAEHRHHRVGDREGETSTRQETKQTEQNEKGSRFLNSTCFL